MNNGGEAFAAMGTENSKGTKVFALTGKIRKGGLVEIPMGKTLRDVIFGIGGGIRDDKEFKAVQMGGPSGGCIPADLLDTIIDYKALGATGAIMGSGGMVVMDESTCMVGMAKFFLDFTAAESCGKCVHCRIGTKRMQEVLTRIVNGEGKEDDIELLEDLCTAVKDGALCGLGQTAPNPVLTTIRYFRNEYEAHINEKKCPAKECTSLLTYSINADACRGCTMCAKKCPVQAISGEVKQAHKIDPDKCIRCGQCIATCKFGAIEVEQRLVMEQIKITVDGQEMTGNKGDTILSIAMENGVEIPNLCYNNELKIYGACGLCVVEAEGIPKLLRACATVASDGMVIHTDSERAENARRVALELLMSDHEGDCKGPCVLNCPAHTDAQEYVKKIAEGDDREAVRIIKEKVPIPASIGRVCPHPCETHCRRGRVEEPLSIAYLKAFAADNDLKSDNPYTPEKAAASGKKVSIIGGGPAGLAAAYRLVLDGHDVTVYDMMPEMGGMLRYGIPEYRLPKAVLAQETKAIESLGVTFKNNVKLGQDITFDEIKNNSDAVLIAVGA